MENMTEREKENSPTNNHLTVLKWNQNMCENISNLMGSTLGPYSMDKLFVNKEGGKILTNDGAKILEFLSFYHPAAKMMVEVAKSQDFEIGDGTTSICLLATKFLASMIELVEYGYHPFQINKIFKKGGILAGYIIKKSSKKIEKNNSSVFRRVLNSCCSTSLNSKLISGKRHIFSKILTEIIINLQNEFDPSLISVKTAKGGGTADSFFFSGIAIKKPFVYAGFERQKKKIYLAKILLLEIDLELQSDNASSEAKIQKMKNYKEIIDAEWSIFFEKLDRIILTKTNCVFSTKSIGDVATQYFSERGVLSGGRVSIEDLSKISVATKGEIVSSHLHIIKNALGISNLVEEKSIGGEKFIFLSGLTRKFMTIILRGSNNKISQETKRSLDDGIRISSQTIKDCAFVGGAGSIEMKISNKLRKYSKTLVGPEREIMWNFSECFEIIPRTLCKNAGLDELEIIAKLRKSHQSPKSWLGVDLERGKTFDSIDNYILEPVSLKTNIIQGSLETACTIFNIDKVLKN
mmetsp:Transcript_9188/g.14498  ORF Transcript_9188/g.14498 Transcript_9188/m.14498 type:complete len:521 (+) Transcript_9188:3517-5079(+)